jgi:uncharacterized membrane protein
MNQDTSRPEAAFVLLLLQSTFWLIAGLSALPFVLGGEVFMLVLGFVSLGLAGVTSWLSVHIVRRRRLARRWVLVLEWVTLIASLLQIALPIGANRGPASLAVNVALPLAVILLLRGRTMRDRFGVTASASR